MSASRRLDVQVSSQVAQMVRTLLALQEAQFRSLGGEDPLEEGMATHSNVLAWRIPRTEEPDGAILHEVAKSQTRLME